MKAEKEIVARMLQRQITPERIGFGVAKFDGINIAQDIDDKIKPGDFGFDVQWRRFNWNSPIKVGGCSCSNARLWLSTEGYGEFQGWLTTENPGHDSWGILHFDFYQSNGQRISANYGDFWSPTIHSGGGDGQYWEFYFNIMGTSLYADTAWVSMTSHC
jgi:hypothetical protein